VEAISEWNSSSGFGAHGPVAVDIRGGNVEIRAEAEVVVKRWI